MFGTLETKDLAQIAVSIAGVAILFIYFNRRINSVTATIQEVSESVSQRDVALQEMGQLINTMNERIISLEKYNIMLRQQITSLTKKTYSNQSNPTESAMNNTNGLRQRQPSTEHRLASPKIKIAEPIDPTIRDEPLVANESSPKSPVIQPSSDNGLTPDRMDDLIKEELEELDDLVQEEDSDKDDLKKTS